MTTNYEHWYGTPEKLSQYCTADCYVCIFPSSIPCNKTFGGGSRQIILEWLKSEYKEKHK